MSKNMRSPFVVVIASPTAEQEARHIEARRFAGVSSAPALRRVDGSTVPCRSDAVPIVRMMRRQADAACPAKPTT
jgi:hypothetical protein